MFVCCGGEGLHTVIFEMYKIVLWFGLQMFDHILLTTF